VILGCRSASSQCSERMNSSCRGWPVTTDADSISARNVDFRGSPASTSRLPVTPGSLALRLATSKCQTDTMTCECTGSRFQVPVRRGDALAACHPLKAAVGRQVEDDPGQRHPGQGPELQEGNDSQEEDED